jgi:hypothetical protein
VEQNNDLLESLTGFSNLLTTNGALTITSNTWLSGIDGFNALTNIQFGLTITQSGCVTIGGFNNLTYVGSSVSITVTL